MKKVCITTFLIFLEIFLLFALISKPKFKNEDIYYKISKCGFLEKQLAIRNRNTNSMLIFVNVNCCSDSIEVKKKDDILWIYEKDYDGNLCRCFCTKRIEIENIGDIKKVILKEWNGKEREVKIEEFCGTSTFGKCENDEDCIVNGCSNQVCRSKFEEPIITTCEYKECYRYLKYFSCKCVNGKCQWTIS